jgi:hypothetical protein
MVPSTFEGGIKEIKANQELSAENDPHHSKGGFKEIKANQELSAENDPLMYKTGCGG